MMEERYRATTKNRFYPDMSNVNKNITVEAKHISPPMNVHKQEHQNYAPFSYFATDKMNNSASSGIL
jgi:hypothetical protein